jgi:hypothetical protein
MCVYKLRIGAVATVQQQLMEPQRGPPFDPTLPVPAERFGMWTSLESMTVMTTI